MQTPPQLTPTQQLNISSLYSNYTNKKVTRKLKVLKYVQDFMICLVKLFINGVCV